MEEVFEKTGFFKEYWVNNKFIGYCHCEKDRELTGYYGRKEETITEEIILTNKKKIKPGVTVLTTIYPMCGKSIK